MSFFQGKSYDPIGQLEDELDEEEPQKELRPESPPSKPQPVKPEPKSPQPKRAKERKPSTKQIVFRENLKLVMRRNRINENALAIKCGFDKDGQKWLRRALRDGLDRRNGNTEDWLKTLCEMLDTPAHELWNSANKDVVYMFLRVWDQAALESGMQETIGRKVADWDRHLRSQAEWRAKHGKK